MARPGQLLAIHWVPVVNRSSFTTLTKSVIAGTCVVLAGVAGCSSGPSDAPDGESPSVDISAELDRETGAIVVPEDRYRLSEVEMFRLDDAKDALVAACAESKGVPFVVPMTDADEYLYSMVFGVWTKDAAERFGFIPPSPASDLAANNVMVDGEPVERPSSSSQVLSVRAAWSDADREVVDDCQASPEVMALDSAQFYSGGPWTSEFSDVSASFLRSSEAEVPLAEYEACLQGRGIASGDDGPLSVEGADYFSINQEQIALALEVVECKDEVSLVQRLADALAAKQAPIVEKYAAELVAHRQAIDAKLAEADQILAEHEAQQ